MDPDLILCMYSNTVESTEKKEKCLIGRERERGRERSLREKLIFMVYQTQRSGLLS